MSLKFRIDDQILTVHDSQDATEAVVHKYDAFLNLLCGPQFAFQRDAIRMVMRFFVSDKYQDVAQLGRDAWGRSEGLRHRYDSLDAFLNRLQLRDRQSVSLDLATGTGKSFAMYGIAAIMLAEGLADRVLVLCPSVTIEEGLLDKFRMLAGDGELATIMRELDAATAIPGVKRGNETIQAGDICVENIHAVYANTGSSIRDSLKGRGDRTLVLNDEAHHLFSPPDKGLKEWMKFLQDDQFGFRRIVNVTGTAYIGDDYFPDVVFRYGLKQAIADGVVKKPDYKTEDTFEAQDWQKTYAVHKQNQADYGDQLKPISIVVTQEIARCVEVWKELVEFLEQEEGLTAQEAEAKAIWVTSGVPSSGERKARVTGAYRGRSEKDTPEKRRKENLIALKSVDSAESPVEWIVSVSMLTEGWDVKNVFQIVPHESRAFSSKLLIAQVLGRGLRVPAGLKQTPLVKINNHEKWSSEIVSLLQEVLEVENTLAWGYDARRAEYAFPLHNIQYEPSQTSVEAKRERARQPDVKFRPQDRVTTEMATFSESGQLAVEIEHRDVVELEDVLKIMRLFLREKDETLAAAWSKDTLREFIVSRLKAAGYDQSFLSKENLLLLQQGFGPMFRELDKEHPRMSLAPKALVVVDLKDIPQQVITEGALREHGSLWAVEGDPSPFDGTDKLLWDQYQKWIEISRIDESGLADNVREIVGRIHEVPKEDFRTPWNVHYASYEPERQFSVLLFARARLFDAFVKMPNVGGYSFPYSFKPAKSAQTHVANEQFNPDFFLRVAGTHEILVVEIKAEGDDSNRNRAKCRDGLRHFELVNDRLKKANEPWRYHFYLLSPDDFATFLDKVSERKFSGWRSGLMQELAGQTDSAEA